MGWWSTDESDNIIGDGPLDTIEEAIDQITAEYYQVWGRPPTVKEVKDTLDFCTNVYKKAGFILRHKIACNPQNRLATAVLLDRMNVTT